MSSQLKLVLVISILASFVAFLDGSVVNVALPSITRDLGGGLQVQQWVVDAYLLTLGLLILVAGSLSDLFGRKKILYLGLLLFGAASLLCAIAQNSSFLIIARAVQGIGGALLVPSSLAIIISSFSGKAQAKAIGTWTAWISIAYVIGPLLGGFLVDTFTWRLIFAINVLPIGVCLWLISRIETTDVRSKVKLDLNGAVLCGLGLLGSVFALIEEPHYGWSNPTIHASFVLGLVFIVAFGIYESRTQNPMLPLGLFKIRNFLVGNIATIMVYGGLSIATFLIVIFLQQVGGYSALKAGLALLPVTAIMFVMSPRFGKLSGKYGPRFFMTVGPVVAGLGFLLMLRVNAHVDYPKALLPGVLVFGIGLSMTVAPLTAAVLGHIEKIHSGIASAINNAISRIAGLIAIAIIGVIVGGKLNVRGFHHAIIVTAVMLWFGGIISSVGIRNHVRSQER